MKKLIYFFALTICLQNALTKAPLDSLKSYRLGEVVIRSSQEEKGLTESKFIDLRYNDLQKLDALSISDLQFFIPSSQIRTNSRGESLLFIRGAGERQLGLFFDGALMNIPWDNRMDLSLVPTDVIGKFTVNKNANSIMYGANILGGAVSISTLERASDGFGATARLQLNDAATQLYSILHDGKIGNFNYIANISYLNSAGFLISANATDTNNQNQGSKMRTNTDKNRLNIYARGEYKFGDLTTIGLAVNHINAEKGVAPEMNLAPKNTRYWRYPLWRRTLITFNGEHFFNKENDFRLLLTGWYDIFNQQIDAYKSIEYKEITETQKDDDKTFGVRASCGFQFIENQFLNFVFNGFASNHIANVNGIESEFSQNIFSTGLEYKGIFNNLEINAGGTYDYK
jgi:iron complex outermembrane receptor protein